MNPQSYNLMNSTQPSYGGLFNAPKTNYGGLLPTAAPAQNSSYPLLYGNTPTIKSTPSGGTLFPAPPTVGTTPKPIASNAGASPQIPATNNPQQIQTPSGGSISMDGFGNPLGYTPGQSYTIPVGGAVPSDAITSSTSMADLQQKRNQYADYVQGLYNATVPNQDYIAALNAVNAATLKDATLQSNLATGVAPGDTLGAAQSFTSREQALNNVNKLGANQSLAVQQAIRQGNIDAYKALVGAAEPTSVSPGSSLVSPISGDATYGGAGAYSDYQAQQTYFNLAQNFPDAAIPAYNPAASAQQNLQLAQSLASQSPSFQSRNLMQVQLPGGGISFINKNQIVTDPKTGQYSIISPVQATAATAASSAVKDLTGQLANTKRAIDTAESNFPLLINIVKKAGVNDYNSPLGNQLQQAVNNRLIGSGDYASYNALLTSLQTEYSQILSRGGSVTDKTRGEAEQIVSGTIGYAALQDLYKTLKAESGNVIKGYSDEIARQNAALGSIYSSGQPLSGGSTQTTPTATTGGKVDITQYIF